MSDPTGESNRDVGQALVAVAAVVALVVAAALVPALAVPFDAPPDRGQGNGGADGDPRRDRSGSSGGAAGGSAGKTGGGFSETGALSPGQRTGVGGPLRPGSSGNGTNATHFTVESDRATYWRTGAYGRYTGDGWERIEDPSLYTGALPAESGDRVVQEVTLRRPTTGLPSAWKPTRVRVEDRDPNVFITEQGALTVGRSLPAGTEYRVTSYVDPPTPERLRDAGRDYPASVDRYRRLPDDTPDRVYSLTDRIARDAENPYETAVAVERWLETNREYRLNVSHNASRPVADQFLFAMDAGYCEYFATAMAVMLRSQGIPARYVVGYAPGTTVGNDTYRVRSLDAHAWVEAYFPGHGWVRFDPTPARERRATEREILAREGVSGDRRPAVQGSPGESRDRFEGDAPPGDAADLRGPPYQVELDESPVPGDRVTVTVSKDGLPVAGVVVTFDGEPVGRTDRNGEVVATVPYVERLRIDATPPRRRAERTAPASGLTPPHDGRVNAVRSIPFAPRRPVNRPGTGTDSLTRGASLDPDGDEAPETYDLPTNVTFAVDGTPAEGRSFVLVPAIHGEPIADASVTFDGRQVGRTDDRGRTRIRVPRTASDPAVVRVERGEVEATARIDLRELRVRVLPHTFLPLPERGATAVVTVGSAPVENATVSVDGERVGRTDEDGTLVVSLPNDDDATVRAAGPVQSASVTVDGIYGSLALVLGVLLGGLGVTVAVPAVALRRRGHAVRDGPSLFLSRVVAAVETAWVAAVRVGTTAGMLAARGGLWIARAAVSTAIVVGRTLRAVAAWTNGTAGAVGAVLAAALATAGGWIADRSARSPIVALAGLPRRGVRALGRGIRFCWLVALGVLPFTGVALDSVFGSAGKPASPAKGDGTAAPADGGSPLPVREAWRSFLRLVGAEDYRTTTPGEVARAAEERGFPSGPVAVLTEAFREVEYGGREEGRSLRKRVTAALGELVDRGESEADENDDGPAGAGGDD